MRWRFKTGSYVFSSPSIGSDGTIFFGSWDKFIYALNPNGTLNWSYLTDGGVTDSPAIGRNGSMYFASQDGSLYAFMGISTPSRPYNLQISSGNGYMNITWDEPDSDGNAAITEYRIFRAWANGLGLWRIISNRTYFNDTDVFNGVNYFYAVAAVNSIGKGQNSTMVNGTPMTTPSAPLGITALAGDTYVNVIWSEPGDNGGSPVMNYILYRGTSPFNRTSIMNLEDTFFYNDTLVTNGMTYFYSVSATNQVGEGPISEVANGTPSTSHPVEDPTSGSGSVNEWYFYTIIIIVVAVVMVFIVYSRF